MLTRRGMTLIELIVAMTVGGVALALIAVISVRQQRLYADVADRAALTGQLRQASAVLPIELRARIARRWRYPRSARHRDRVTQLDRDRRRVRHARRFDRPCAGDSWRRGIRRDI